MNSSAPIMPPSEAAGGGIPLNLAPLLAPYGQHQRLSLRVVHLPVRASLSRGRKNEDASWSLAPDELDGLHLEIPEDVDPPATLAVRIVGFDKNENASVVGQFEVPLPRSESLGRSKAVKASEAASNAAWQRRLDRRAEAAHRLAQRKAVLAASETEARLAAETKKLARQWEQKLLEMQHAGEAAEARAGAAAEAQAALASELETALARAEAAEAAATAFDDHPQPSPEEIEARLAAQAEKLETAWKQKLRDACDAREAAEDKAEEVTGKLSDLTGELETALARADAAEAAVAALDDSPQPSEEEIEARIAEARAEGQRESDERLAAATAEAARSAVAAAESKWAEESEARVAAAVAEALQKAEADAEARLEKARAAWRQESAAELDAAQQRCMEAEATVQQLATRLEDAEARTQAAGESSLVEQEQALELEWRQKLLEERGAREAAEAKAAEATQKLAPLSGELQAALARAEAAEKTVASLENGRQRHAQETEARIAKDMEQRSLAVRNRWEAETEARVADAQEEATRKAEAVAKSKLVQARKEWEDEMQSTLAAEKGKWQAESARQLSAAKAELNRSVQASATAGRRKLRGVARRQWMVRIWPPLRRLALVSACLAAGFFFYKEFKPTILGEWKPKVVALAGDAKTLAIDASDAALDQLREVIDGPQQRLAVAADVANLRGGPSTKSEVVGRLLKDSTVSVIERRGDWLRVRAEGGGDGWLHRSLLTTAEKR